MKIFNRSKLVVLARILFGGFIAIIAGVAFISTGDPVSIMVGMLFLTPVFYILYAGFKYPFLIIKDNQIIITNILGKTREITDLDKYKLIISIDYLAFRKEGASDIMVNKTWNTGKQWNVIVSYLESLKFQEIVK